MFRLLLIFMLLPMFGVAQIRVTAIKDVNIVNVETGKILQQQIVLLEGKSIIKIGSKIKIPPAAVVVNGKGKYLIPGLVDFNAGVLNYEYAQEEALSLMLANGITSVRDLQPKVPLGFGRQLKYELESGKRSGPRLYTISYLITTRGTREKKVVVLTPEQAIKAVDDAATEKVDFIKLDYTLPPATMQALIARAKYYGIKTVGGINTSFIDASEAGIHMIDHASDLRRVTTINRNIYFQFYQNDSNRIVPRDEFYNRVLPSLGTIDSVYFQQLISVMRKNNTWLVISPASQMPSISKFEILDSSRHIYKSNRQLLALKKAKEENEKVTELERYKSFVDMKEIKWAFDLGLNIVAGSQLYEFMTPGFSLHDTFYWMQENGFTPIEILRTATILPAKFMNKEKELGTIEEGKLADLVLLNNNPLTDIKNLKDIKAVWVNGEYLDRDRIDAMLKAVNQKVKAL